jgi:hypothetical protein
MHRHHENSETHSVSPLPEPVLLLVMLREGGASRGHGAAEKNSAFRDYRIIRLRG